MARMESYTYSLLDFCYRYLWMSNKVKLRLCNRYLPIFDPSHVFGKRKIKILARTCTKKIRENDVELNNYTCSKLS